jgi:endonuclease YncB( thermonuclease family)
MHGIARRRATRLLALALALWLSAGAAPLPDPGVVAVAAVIDGSTLDLADGRRVRLAGIVAPEPPLGRAEGLGWRRATEAMVALRELALGRAVTLRTGAAADDRYSRVVAQLWRDDGLWLQGELLRRGFVRYAGTADDRVLAAEMLALESEARAGRRGLWRDAYYAVRAADEAGRYTDSFQLVEGVVADAAKVKGGEVYVNLGPDWRTAFALHLARPALALFKASGVDPLALKGSRIRVRGWLRFDRRPLVDVTYPEQIEVLAAP